mmetsp:Transcript_61353/g.168523  ORF Transcript_61353/g.168523 Transcript_61353/m.168523 type:complete len:220 (-) Transcript_61353:1363-2022(-)
MIVDLRGADRPLLIGSTDLDASHLCLMNLEERGSVHRVSVGGAPRARAHSLVANGKAGGIVGGNWIWKREKTEISRIRCGRRAVIWLCTPMTPRSIGMSPRTGYGGTGQISLFGMIAAHALITRMIRRFATMFASKRRQPHMHSLKGSTSPRRLSTNGRKRRIKLLLMSSLLPCRHCNLSIAKRLMWAAMRGRRRKMRCKHRRWQMRSLWLRQQLEANA